MALLVHDFLLLFQRSRAIKNRLIGFLGGKKSEHITSATLLFRASTEGWYIGFKGTDPKNEAECQTTSDVSGRLDNLTRTDDGPGRPGRAVAKVP